MLWGKWQKSPAKVPRILNNNLHASPKTRHTTTHHQQHQCWNFTWQFCAPQCTPGPPPPHRPPTPVWWTPPTQRQSAYFCKDPKGCSLGPQSSITEILATSSRIPPAHSLHPAPPHLQRTEPDQRDAADTVQLAPEQIRTICAKVDKKINKCT